MASPCTRRRAPARSISPAAKRSSATHCAPPIATERLETRPDGLVRIALKHAYADGTVAVDMVRRPPATTWSGRRRTRTLSLLCRLATSVPPPRFHTVKYAGVLAPASPWRARIAPTPPALEPGKAEPDDERKPGASTYRP
jgi:hypothetical protein